MDDDGNSDVFDDGHLGEWEEPSGEHSLPRGRWGGMMSGDMVGRLTFQHTLIIQQLPKMNKPD